MNKNWIIVGISGCTNGGKTTLATFFQKSFPGSIVVNQDQYFRPDDSKEHILIPELNHKNWDCVAAINWDAMMDYVKQILSSEPSEHHALFIVEGHLIFNYSPLEKLFHKRYFLKLNKEECFRRRCTRVYDPPDVPGYFEKCVWPMYLSNFEELQSRMCNITYLDGTNKVEVIHKTVMDDLKNYLSNR